MVNAQLRMEPPHYGNQVNPPPPHTNSRQTSAVETSSRQVERDELESPGLGARPLALLLDLSGDESAAMAWATARLPGVFIQRLDKTELKWTSKREALARVRSIGPDVFCVFAADLSSQSSKGALLLFALLAGARRMLIGDSRGGDAARTRLGVLMLEAPRFALELLVGYGLVVPLSLLLTEVISISLAFRGPVRASRISSPPRPASLLFIRATLSGATEGGMPTHIAGFFKGATALGHRLKFLASAAQSASQDTTLIPPSTLFSATRTLFELWNNLVFTMRSLQRPGPESADKIDFIYQRYSRFNWTGVLLSAVTGLPLALEFNGSEVWVSRNWDPAGLLWLLGRFERLNLRAADLIFVVSEVERRNLIDAGVSPERIIVNPNGVDPDRFHPDCGGRGIRHLLGIEDQIVVGFVGTFGPWHGAPLLAEAATKLEPETRCHFVFIGGGEQRAQTESIIHSAAVRATFTGNIPHDRVPAYLDACDILASPHVRSADGSEFFGSPTKLFEYLAMGKAIVASRLGQVGEVIIDGENGLLVEPGDADGLARSIETLAGDDDLRARLGAAARSSAIERFTWRHNAARVFDAIGAVLTR